MRIAYLHGGSIPSFFANGVHVMRMCDAFTDAGHEVTLYSLPGSQTDEDPYEYYGARHRFPIRPAPRLRLPPGRRHHRGPGPLGGSLSASQRVRPRAPAALRPARLLPPLRRGPRPSPARGVHLGPARRDRTLDLPDDAVRVHGPRPRHPRLGPPGPARSPRGRRQLPTSRIGTTVLNVGAGVSTSVLDVLSAVEELTGRAVPVSRLPAQAGDVDATLADCSKAAALLSWKPRTTLVQGISRRLCHLTTR